MFYYSATEKLVRGEKIKIFNYGNMKRDFTYVDDIVEGVLRTMERIPRPDPTWDATAPDPATSSAPWRIYNIGNNTTVELSEFIATLERALGMEAVKNYLPMQPGDVEATYADVRDLIRDTGFSPSTPLSEGIAHFVEWYKSYYK